MNCKPNELAIVVRVGPRVPELLGRICTTLHLAPSTDFNLPDGQPSFGNNSGMPAWVVEFANPIRIPLGIGNTITRWRRASYAVVLDSALRPIRGDEQPEAEHTQVGKPVEVTA